MKVLCLVWLLWLGVDSRLEAREPSGRLSWDLAQLAAAVKLSPEQTREYFTDGRRLSFLLERRVAFEVMQGKLAPSETTAYDLTDREGRKWDVRAISRQGTHFTPSGMVGSGRSFNRAGFYAKLDGLEGFVLADIDNFPDIPYWLVSAAQVRAWYEAGKLGRDAKVTRAKILRLLAE